MRKRIMRACALVTALCLLSSVSVAQAASPPVATPPSAVTDIDLAPADIAALVELLKSCDGEVQKGHVLQADKDAIIAKQAETITQLDKTVQDERAAQGGILKSTTTWFIIGALFTGVVYRLTRP
jgi:hypothetical protein